MITRRDAKEEVAEFTARRTAAVAAIAASETD